MNTVGFPYAFPYAFIPVIIVYLTHYFTSQLYANLCVPFTWEGFFLSVLTTASPVCTGLLNIINTSSQSYGIAISGGITWFLTKLFTS
jgi:hypothetical protein